MTTRLVFDTRGTLHATWATNTRKGFGNSLYHAFATPPYRHWSEPWRFAERSEDELHGPGWPYLAVAPDGVLHLIRTPGGIVGRTYRTSTDGGRTWSEPEAILTGMHGINGYVFPLWDGAGGMHLIVNMRTAPEAVVGIYYSYPTADGFSEPRPVDTTSVAAPTAHHAVGVVRLGNELHLVYVQNDVGEIWHLAGTVVGVPASAPEPLPTPAAPPRERTPTTHTALTADDGGAARPLPVAPSGGAKRPRLSAAAALIVSALAATVACAVGIAISRTRRR
jgi:hypothetical protein